MAGAINNATAIVSSSLSSKIGLWDQVTNALRSMTLQSLTLFIQTQLNSYFMPLIAPGTSGNVLTSNGSSWTSVAPSGGGGGVGTGWTAGLGTWTYSSADAPTFVISTSVDNSTAIGVGDRITYPNDCRIFYCNSHYFQYHYSLRWNKLCTGKCGNFISSIQSYKNPLGFPASPANWTVEFTDAISRKQNTPAQNIWYNLGGTEQITIPIGLWRVLL